MHPRLQAQNNAHSELTASRFFGEICPNVLDQRRKALEKIGGTYAFVVRGAGRWVLDFDACAVVGLADGVKAEVDLAIEIDDADFTRLMKGTLDVPRAMTEHRIVVSGNTSLFPNLTAALRPAA